MSGAGRPRGRRTLALSRRTLLGGGIGFLVLPFASGRARAQSEAVGEAVEGEAAEAAPVQPVRIGFAHPMAGVFRALGTRCRLGAYRAVQRINAAGGIASLGGAPLRVVEGNIGAESGAAAEAVQALNRAGVAAVIGAATTPLSRQVARAAGELSLPHLVDAAIGTEVTDQEVGRSLRLGPDYDQLMSGLVTLLDGLVENGHAVPRVTESAAETTAEGTPAAEPPDLTIAILRDPYAYGTRVEEDLSARLAEQGGEGQATHRIAIASVRDLWPRLATPTAVATFLQEPGADAVVLVGYGEAEATLFAALAERELGLPVPVISFLGGISTSDSFGPDALAGAEGVVELTVAPDPQKVGTAALREAFAEWGIPLSYEAYLAHESVLLLADALERAGTTERTELLAALQASGWESDSLPFGPTAFDAGRNTAAVPQGFQLRNGTLVPIGPDGAGFVAPALPAN